MSRTHIYTPVNIAERASDIVTSFFGSWTCVSIHTVWFVAWLGLRLDINLLTMVVSLEAIYLSTLVMISQNRQAMKDHIRDDIESVEVQEIYDGHQLLLQINKQQLEILKLLQNGGGVQ